MKKCRTNWGVATPFLASESRLGAWFSARRAGRAAASACGGLVFDHLGHGSFGAGLRIRRGTISSGGTVNHFSRLPGSGPRGIADAEDAER